MQIAMPREAVLDFVSGLGVDLPPAEDFWRLGDVTALRRAADGSHFCRVNYERGPLLYALVRSLRPRTILEIGTARGYSTLCMAWALCDAGLDGTVYSIDATGPRVSAGWAFDWHDGAGPHLAHTTRERLWARAAQPAWRERIVPLTGYASARLSRWPGPAVDLVFIDGDHSYEGVRQDFYRVLPLLGERVAVLFDDYDSRARFGVARLVDEEVAPRLDCTLLTNDGKWSDGEYRAVGHSMAWATGDGPPGWLARAFDPATEASFLAECRRRDRWRAARRQVRELARRVVNTARRRPPSNPNAT